MKDTDADWLSYQRKEGKNTLSIFGVWRIRSIKQIREALDNVDLTNAPTEIKCEALEELDTACAALLFAALAANKIPKDSITFHGLGEKERRILELAQNFSPTPASPKRQFWSDAPAALGKWAIEVWQELQSPLGLIGDAGLELGRTVLQPTRLRLKELFVQLESVGLNAVPIVCLVTFLIGIVIAYLTGNQLQYYGANIFIVDGVAIAMCRELSPILVAIIVAGRSGSAFTAQIGTMKLNQEVDALEVLGLSPVRILVVPRLLALMLAMPILVFFGDIAGIFGGMLVADMHLDVTGTTFVERLAAVLRVKHVTVGLVKAPVFAFFIAIIGCRLGLSVEQNARSVGLHTTSTVVQSIVAVILLNAAFAIVLSELGI